jgi:hypothetical protein
MTIYMTPKMADERILKAFRTGEDLLDSRFPRDAAIDTEI